MKPTPDPDCPICSKGTFGIPGCLVLDVMQVEAARQRWQWCDLDAGANDCPCIQPHPAQHDSRTFGSQANGGPA